MCFRPLIQANATVDFIEKFAVGICELMKPDCTTPEGCEDLCKGVVAEHAREVIQILTETVLAPAEVCYLVGQCPAPPPPQMKLPAARASQLVCCQGFGP